MPELDSGTISIFGKPFQVFGLADDAWYQAWKGAGMYNEFNLKHLEHLIAQDDICVDVGANVGMITLALSVLAPKGHVYAFEGSDATTRALSRTVAANTLTNVSAAKCGRGPIFRNGQVLRCRRHASRRALFADRHRATD
jgi:hypothetical protein